MTISLSDILQFDTTAALVDKKTALCSESEKSTIMMLMNSAQIIEKNSPFSHHKPSVL
jgi:hypothetical protein